MKSKNILFTICKVLLHLVGFPLLAALVLVLNLNVIKGGMAYGVFVFVCLIVVAVMALIYYLAYFLVRTKKGRSIRNQTIIVVIVAFCCLSGFWMLLDGVIADPLESATSSTIRWEDLSDNWEARGEVNHQLLVDYVTMNYHLGRLTAPNGETIDDYVAQGPSGNEELATLLKTDFEDIDGDGYASFKGPSVDYAQDDRMTIPALIHLFLDDRSVAQGVNSSYEKVLQLPVAYYYNPSITKAKAGDEAAADSYVLRIYHGYDEVKVGSKKQRMKAFLVTDDDLNLLYSLAKVNVVSVQDGKYNATHSESKKIDSVYQFETTTEQFDNQADAIAYLQTTYACGDDYYVGAYRMATVSWHVLDMLGEGMAMDMSGLFSEELLNTEIGVEGVASIGKVSDILASDLLPDALALVADMLNEPELLGSPLYITLNTSTGELSLEPSNAHRGVLGYMQIAWLDNNGLLYLLVSLFSLRTIFYIYGPVMMIITLLLGVVREMEKKYKETAVATQGAEAAAPVQESVEEAVDTVAQEEQAPQAEDDLVLDDVVVNEEFVAEEGKEE